MTVKQMTAADIAHAVGVVLHGGDVAVTGISTDTRTIGPGMLFVAIRGPVHDGHLFVAEALDKGAVLVLSLIHI